MFTDSSDCRLPTARMSVVDVVARALVVSTGTPWRRGCPLGSCAQAGPASRRATWMSATIAVIATASAVAITRDFAMETALLTPRPKQPDPNAATLSQKKPTTIRRGEDGGGVSGKQLEAIGLRGPQSPFRPLQLIQQPAEQDTVNAASLGSSRGHAFSENRS